MRSFPFLLALVGLGLAFDPAAARPRHTTATKSAARSHAGASGRSHGASGHGKAGSGKAGSGKAGGSRRGGRGHGDAAPHHGRTSGRYARRAFVPAAEAPHAAAGDDVTAAPEVATASPEAAAEQARAAAARGDNAEALSRYLHVLARRPDDVASLVGAGRAALEVGDLNAATGFFAHAQDIAPQNGQVEAGLGAVSVQNNDPRAALRYLKSAETHGVAPADLASDRALAYDLRGDPRRAQLEYLTALRAKPGNAALLRRLALSQAIAGDRTGAFVTLDPLLRRQDVAAWRTRAFVRAITGDLPGAEQDAAAVVPAYQMGQLRPYLARLAALRPAEKAAAVNLGRFPQPGARPSATADAAPPSRLSYDLQAVAGASGAGTAAAAPVPSVATPARATAPALPPPAADAAGRAAAMARLTAMPVSSAPVQPTPASPVATIPAPPPGPPAPPPNPPAPPIVAAPTIQPQATAPVRRSAAPSSMVDAPAPPKVDPAVARAQARAAALAAQREKARKAAEAEQAAEEKAHKAELKANPARSWVQVAGGANKADLPKEWAKLRTKWPDQLGGREPWTTHYRFTNRLLVGPFASAAAAQSWVSERRKEGLATFRVDTDAGEPVERLGK